MRGLNGRQPSPFISRDLAPDRRHSAAYWRKRSAPLSMTRSPLTLGPKRHALFNYLICGGEQGRRDIEPK
jgi:hypothetical protein